MVFNVTFNIFSKASSTNLQSSLVTAKHYFLFYLHKKMTNTDLSVVHIPVQSESRLDNGVFSNDLSHTGIGHVLENIDQVLKIHSFLSL